ncbi:glycosyltransferase family A protein [Microbacterium murale]|uniref:Glycosyltransferase 2-like domain-containing protein n=1 Tax=Microbacterium murale TaxID=1081040 RepID=A0ABU0PCI6_9MICO|nr:glycosyltransferase family A protein [Microbacterium murale]MDQ0645038.1 hypothetical protein [Microbacterium murale]
MDRPLDFPRRSGAVIVDADVDVVIAAHDPERRVDRAVASVLTSQAVARVLIVCHNTPVEGIAERLGALADDVRVHLIDLQDGVRSPAGPFNHGLDLAEARFVSIMGSDDELTSGAIDRWYATAVRHQADVVIPVVRYAGAHRVATPPTRFWRTTSLDGVRDRLAYRTAPLGLVSRERFAGLRFTPGMLTGEDLAYSTRMWFSDAVKARVRTGAEYLVHDDAMRVTFTRRPLRDEFAALEHLLAQEDIRRMGPKVKVALAVKLWRISVFGAAHYRGGSWSDDDRRAVASAAQQLRDYAPAALDVLSVADGRLIEALQDRSTPDETVDAASARRRRFVTLGALLTRRPWTLLAREAPIRFAVATLLAGRG